MTESQLVDVAIIGAGLSGLAAAKAWKEAGATSLIVFEERAEVGGYFCDNDYFNAHATVSKYSNCFSDFPYDKQVAAFPHHADTRTYLHAYARAFGLYNYIRFSAKVERLRRPQFEKRWTLHVREGGRLSEYKARFVAIATGYSAVPIMPLVPGLSTFPGLVVHSSKFVDANKHGLAHKQVLVVGAGNSAAAVAVHLLEEGRCAVHISSRSPAWVLPNHLFGCPLDVYFNRALSWSSWPAASALFGRAVRLVYGRASMLRASDNSTGPLEAAPTVSTALITHLQLDDVAVHPAISSVSHSRVLFANGSSDEFDAIILCTGYKVDVSFLEMPGDGPIVHEGVIDADRNILSLYKNMFVSHLDSSLAFVGFVQPYNGAIMPLVELQSRWWVQLCLGNDVLPTQDAMEQDVLDDARDVMSRFRAATRHTTLRDTLSYCDFLAYRIGVAPSLLQRPWLAPWILFGTAPAQYRLRGRYAAADTSAIVSSPLPHCIVFTLLAAVGLLLMLLVYVVVHVYSLFA